MLTQERKKQRDYLNLVPARAKNFNYTHFGQYKIPLDEDVFTAAQRRVAYLFDNFNYLYVSFSGGKDSGVLLNLAIEEAERRNRLPVDVLVVDFEAQYKETERFIERMVGSDKVRVYWICLPLSLRNSVSQFEPKWVCWDKNKQRHWVRSMPSPQLLANDSDIYNDAATFPFFSYAMEFEDFVFDFAHWYQAKKQSEVAVLIGLRADESLHRYNTIKNHTKETFRQCAWTTKMQSKVYMAYPIYDWKTRDIWIANGRKSWDYNRIYDLMYKAGVALSQQRLCQPFGDQQRKSLWLYQILEPDTWQKLVDRVEGGNFGARYSKDQGRIMGYYRFDLPKNFTYRQYSKHLLNSMPPHLAKHYRKRIYQFLQWWRRHGRSRGVYRIPDFACSKLEAKKQVPSWRRICKVLIKNDYWCRGLSFGHNKSVARQYHTLHKKHIESGNVYGN